MTAETEQQRVADERLVAALKALGVFARQDELGRIFYTDGDDEYEVAVVLEGTVTLIEICSGAVDCGAMAMDQRWGVGISGGSVERGNLTPDREALIYFGSPLGRAEPMPSWSKVRGDGAKGRQEPLGMPHRFKAFHRPFALSGGLMRVLGAIVEIPRLPVGHRRHELAVSNPVAGQFVGHQHARYILQALE